MLHIVCILESYLTCGTWQNWVTQNCTQGFAGPCRWWITSSDGVQWKFIESILIHLHNITVIKSHHAMRCELKRERSSPFHTVDTWWCWAFSHYGVCADGSIKISLKPSPSPSPTSVHPLGISLPSRVCALTRDRLAASLQHDMDVSAVARLERISIHALGKISAIRKEATYVLPLGAQCTPWWCVSKMQVWLPLLFEL